MRLLRNIIKNLLTILLPAVGISMTSCDRLHEDLDPCATGVRLRFVYDYNMEYANAFPSQVDCLTLLIYDANGNYIKSERATRPQTEDENWRMTLDLPSGKYRMLAYGGMLCDEASFSFVNQPESIPEEEVEVKLDPQYLSESNRKPLHHLFYGQLNLEIPPAGINTSYTEATVYMIKDTNDIRILLANDAGKPTDEADFAFTITDNNSLLDWKNDPVDIPAVTYHPWAKGNVVAGVYADGPEAQMAYAELSVSRLMANSSALLKVTRVSDGKEVISIPLVKILLLLKSERYKSMKSQEFLDRQSRWNLTFFLTGEDVWLKTTIVINDWEVRINNIEQ